MAIIIYYLITYDFNTIAYYFCNFATGNAIFSIHDRTVHRSLSCLLHAYILKNLKKKIYSHSKFSFNRTVYRNENKYV